MEENLSDNPKYTFAVAFLTWVDALEAPNLPEGPTPLGILQMLPSLPQRAVSPTITDTLADIFEQTDQWTPERILAADNALSTQGAMTLSLAREAWPFKRRRT